MESVLRIVDRVIALTFYIGSAAVTALLTVLFIHYALRVPPDVLRVDAFMSAGLVGVLLLLATAAAHRDEK